jgi:hypothetical protein
MESTMDQQQIVAHLLAKADRYRDFARRISDSETVRQILGLTEELKQRARMLARSNEDQIRKRARELWEHNGQPAGRDLEFWLQAEREFREADRLAKKALEDIE